MGRPKAWLPFGDQTLLQRVVATVAQVVGDVVVVRHAGQDLPTLPRDVLVVEDEHDDQGPLGGLIPGLRASDADAVYATGCDVPFLRPAFVELLFERVRGHAVAVAETEGFTHPLAAVYRTSTWPVMAELLAAGRRRPLFLFDEVPTERVAEDDLRRADPELLSLENLNTPDAYDAALARRAEIEAS